MHGPTRKLPALLLLRDRFCTDRGGAIVQLPRIGHLAYSAPADYATGTDAVDYRKLQATASRSYSVCRTTQLGSFSRHQDDPFVEDVTLDSRSAEDRLPSGSANVQSAQHVHPGVPSSPNPGSTIDNRPPRRCVSRLRRRHLQSVPSDAQLQLSGFTENCSQ